LYIYLVNYAPVPRSLRTRAFLFALLFCLGVTLPTFATNKKPPLKPININAATSEELQQVPGIGPVTAEKIVQMRKSYGPFKSVDDLLAIKGLGRKRLDKMRKYLTVGKPAGARPTAQEPAKVSSETPPSHPEP
jgi:comEA protein